jgi:transposase
MARPFTYTQAELERAKDLRDNPQNPRDTRAAVSFILMAESGLTRNDLANAFGVTPKTIFEDIKRIRNPETQTKGRWGGGHNHLLGFEKEAQFLEKHIEDAKAGIVITMPKLHDEYNKLVGKKTPKSTFYRMLKRHNWRQVLPDTRHPKADPELQEEFKKQTLKKILGKILKQNKNKRPLYLMFQDEARFGRLSDPRRCWAPAPYRPKVLLSLVRQFKYVFGSVCPATGHLDYMIADNMKTENMSKFLKQVSRAHPDKSIVMVLDGASSHKSKSLVIPSNVELVYLPPYSPELNPSERLWNQLRRNKFANRYFGTLEETIHQAELGLSEMKKDRKALKSLTLWPWIINILNAT